jgi:hypothetical protein
MHSIQLDNPQLLRWQLVTYGDNPLMTAALANIYSAAHNISIMQ